MTTGRLARPKPRSGRGWPPARRAAQAARCRTARPWRHATGPRTAAGKARSRLNGLRHAMRSAPYARLRRLLEAQARFLDLFGRDKSPVSLAGWAKTLYIAPDSFIKKRVAAFAKAV